jgi:hypothetical protein
MTDSIGPSINRLKVKPPFSTFYCSFLVEVGRFFFAMAKNGENSLIFFTVGLIDRSILSIVCVQMDRWPSDKDFMIDCRYYRSNIKNL